MNLLGHLRHRDEEGNQVSDYIAYTVKAVDRGLELCEKAETLHGTWGSSGSSSGHQQQQQK